METEKTSMTEPPKFKFLDDNCSDCDLTEGKTHQRIADQLHDLIVSGPPDGMTIGLEGDWGSGKSTVIELLQQKLEQNNESKGLLSSLRKLLPKCKKSRQTFFFYIDAWEHEGDPLRRVFLEALIDKLKKSHVLSWITKNKLEKIRKRVPVKKSATKLTGLGLALAGAGLLMPLVAKQIPPISLQTPIRNVAKFFQGLNIWVVLLCVVAVLLVWQILKIVFEIFGKPAVFSTERTTGISIENERTSIEFSICFNEILEAIKPDFDKIVMVIDNLDRIDPKDALRGWSTLQTFVQRKNPLGKQKKGIAKWIVVPYAQEGLGRLWDNAPTKAREQKDEPVKLSTPVEDDVSRIMSFMDKCFDLRIHVPKMLIGDWQVFAKQCIHEAAPGLEPADAETMLNVLNWTRDHLAEVPSPRQIKLYVNHVGMAWRIHAGHTSLMAICFYVVLKHLKGIPDEEMVRSVVVGNMSHKVLPGHALPKMEELAAIIHGVSEDKAARILLGPIIGEGLKQSATDHLRIWRKTYGEEVFDTVACHVLGRAEFYELPKYIASIQKAFPEHESKVCTDAFHRLQENRSNRDVLFANLEHADALALMEIASQEPKLAKQLAEFYMQQLPLCFTGSKSTASKSILAAYKIESGEDFIEKLRQVSKAAGQEIKLPYPALDVQGFQFYLLAEKEMAELASILVDPDEADVYFSRHINSILINTWMVDWLSALIRQGMRKMENVLRAIEHQLAVEHHIEGITIGDSQPHVARLLLALDILPIHERPIEFIKKMLRSPVLEGTVDFSEPWMLYLLSKYNGDELAEEFDPPWHPDSCLAVYNGAWTTSEGDAGVEVYQFSARSGEYEWLAREAARSNRQLARGIIQAAVNAGEKRLFDVPAPFKFLVDAWNLTDGEMHDALLENFVSDEKRLERLGETGGETLTEFPEVCRALLEKCSEMPAGKSLFGKCNGELQRVAQEAWNEAFENGPLVPFLVFLVQKGQAVNLGAGFYNAFKGLVADALNNGTATIFLYGELLALYQAMGPTFRKLFASQIGRQLLEIQFRVGGEQFLRFLLEVPDYSDWLEEKPSEILDALVGLAQEKDLEPMARLATLLACHGERLSYWGEIKEATKPFLDQMLQHSDEENRKWGQKIAKELEEGAKKAELAKAKRNKPDRDGKELPEGGEA